MSRKRIADIILKKILGGTSDKSLRQIARGQGYKSIDEWVEGGAEGLTKGLKKEAEIERRTAATETRERRRAHGKKTDDPEFKEKFEETYVAPQKELRALEEAERKERTGFNPNIFINRKLKSDLFKAREAASALENLRRTGPARRNLTEFTENLTNERIIKQAIREGYVNPVKWEEAGLPPWPEEFRNLANIAKIRLGFGETKEGMGKVLTPLQARKHSEELRRLSRSKEPPKDPRQFDVEEARERARREIRRVGGASSNINKTAPSIGTLRADELAEARRQQAESGFEFDPQDVKKTELDYVEKTGDDLGLDFDPSPEVVLADPDFKQARSAWSRAATPPRVQRGSGVDIRGNPVGEELIWSRGLNDAYENRLKQLGVKEKDLTPEEIRGVQEEVAAFSAKEALYPEVDYITPQSLSGSTEVTDKLGLTLADVNRRIRSLDPAEDAEELLELRASKEFLERELQKRFGGKQYVKGGEFIDTDVPFKGERVAVPTMGSPASSMQQILRGDAFTVPEPSPSTIADIHLPSDAVHKTVENIRRNPEMGVPADIGGEEAAFYGWGRKRGRGKRAAIDLEKGLKDPAENISYGAPSTRERVGEVGRLPSYDPKVVSSLRRRATNLRKKRDAFRDEAAQRVIEITDRAPTHPYTKLSAPQRADAVEARDLVWEELRGTPKFQKYMQDKAKLQTEINDKTPGLMEFDQYTRPQRTIDRPRKALPKPYQLDLNLPPTIRQSNLEQAMKEGKVDLRNPAMAKQWEKEAPQRKANQWTIDGYNAQIKKVRKTKGQYDVNKKLAKIQNDTADRFDAIDAGFTKKNKAGETVPDVSAWKKAGSPKPVDPLDKDRRVFPKRKLVDSFKKGRKIVNRKRGGIIKKPRGWGAARYAGR